MDSILDSVLSGLGLNPGQGHYMHCIIGQEISLSQSLSTQVNKWIPANLILGVTLQLTTILSKNVPSCLML